MIISYARSKGIQSQLQKQQQCGKTVKCDKKSRKKHDDEEKQEEEEENDDDGMNPFN